MNRRAWLQMLGGGYLAAHLPNRAAAQQNETLRQAGARTGIRYGANPYAYPPVFSPAYDRLVVEQCSLIVPNLSWSLVEPRPGVFRQDADLGVVAFAAAHNLALTGFMLLWYYRMPKWFEAFDTAGPAEQAIVQHITDMGTRYASRCWSVSVMNETIKVDDGRPDGLRIDTLSRLFGAGYWGIAFRAARRAFPHSLLVYNETYMEQEHRGGLAARRKALLGRLDAERAAGTPIDAVGLQSHLTLAQPFDTQAWTAFLNEIASRGLKIVISELDIMDLSAPADIAARDQAVADMYQRFLEPTLDQRAVVGLVTWGMSDRYTWLVPASSQSFARPDHLPMRPLPFDEEFRPKAAYTAILRALQSAPLRPPWTPK